MLTGLALVCLRAGWHWICQTWGKLLITSHRSRPYSPPCYQNLATKPMTVSYLWQHATISYGSHKASRSKKKQAKAEALYWLIITFLYPLVPHPQSLVGEDLLACGSFVLLICHHASIHSTFMLIKELDFPILFLHSFPPVFHPQVHKIISSKIWL